MYFLANSEFRYFIYGFKYNLNTCISFLRNTKCFVLTTASSSTERVHSAVEKAKILRTKFEIFEQDVAAQFDYSQLSKSDWIVHVAHAKALECQCYTYKDPESGKIVRTRLCHFLRQRCCGNACRHCVYSHENVPEPLRLTKVFNTSFWKPVGAT